MAKVMMFILCLMISVFAESLTQPEVIFQKKMSNVPQLN